LFSSIRIASRNTPLAKVQTYLVCNEIKKIKTIHQLDLTFRDIPELENPLQTRETISSNYKRDLKLDLIDFAVHSHKNLALEPSVDTEIISVLRRADPRDVLLLKKKSFYSPSSNLLIFSSYTHKEHNILQFLKEFSPVSLRKNNFHFQTIQGTISSRLEQWESKGDGILLSKGSLDYLLLENYPQANEVDIKLTRDYIRKLLLESFFLVLPLSQSPSDPGQGGIALEFKKGRSDLQKIANHLSIYAVREEIEQEREEAKFLGHSLPVSYLKRGYGTVVFKKGTTAEGKPISSQFLKASHQPKARTISKVYPTPEETKNIRKPLDSIESPPPGNLFLIKKNSWLSHWKKEDIKGILWTASLTTFKDLTDRDFWVSGCSDGLGEGEDPYLFGFLEDPQFIKLSHTNSELVPSRYERFPTYSLKLSPFPDLREKTHFFWMSGYQFEEAIKKYPQILNFYHACCPGITRNYIQKKVKSPVDTFLTYQAWYDYHIVF
jgi:hydroxymethylbilane synthase